MKRSEINRALRDMEKMIDRCSFKLPPFCYFTPEEWNEKGHEYDEVRDNMLGWDITDFGMGLYMKEGQSAAMHFHWNKMEDIINRGGGNVLIGVYNAGREEELADTDVRIHSDGREYTVPAGTQIRLCPGESITIQPYLYHDFHLEPGTGSVLLGEVSMCNDDNRDNRFYLPAGRFPVIEEDEPPFRLLCNEYPAAGSCAKR